MAVVQLGNRRRIADDDALEQCGVGVHYSFYGHGAAVDCGTVAAPRPARASMGMETEDSNASTPREVCNAKRVSNSSKAAGAGESTPTRVSGRSLDIWLPLSCIR